MDSQKRLLLALGLSFLLTMVYVTFFVKPQAERAPPPDAGLLVAAAVPSVDAGIPAGAAAPGSVALAPPAAVEAPPIQEISRNLARIHYSFSSEGAGLTKAQMQGAKMREQQQLTVAQGFSRLFGGEVPKPPQMDMAVPVPAQPLPLAISIEGAQPFPANARFRVVEGGAPGDERLVFRATAGAWEVEKTFEWPSGGEVSAAPAAAFELTYAVSLKNIGAQPAAGELAVHYGRAIDPGSEHAGSFFGGVGNQSRASCRVGEDFESLIPKGDDKPSPEFKGPIRFIGVDQQYFLGAVFPLDGARDGRCVLTSTSTRRSATAYFPVAVAPGQTLTQRFGVFIGPKDSEMLALVPSRGHGSAVDAAQLPHLEKTVDFGIWAVICKVLLFLLKAFHGVVKNWGVAIILLTVLAKLVLLPLTHKSMVSAEAMKKLQPQMEVIKKKFAEDKERQNVEMMKLYQEHKVNPLGGCLPMLFQLPIWAALFTTLRASYELYGEPFVSPLWTDLTYKDPTYILPLALGVTMIVTQKLQPQMMDAAQAKMMTYVMPVFFTAIMLNYPAGLALYIFTNNLLSIAQQYALRRYLEKKGIASPRQAKADKKLVKERKA